MYGMLSIILHPVNNFFKIKNMVPATKNAGKERRKR
jgi:hypothetical protein